MKKSGSCVGPGLGWLTDRGRLLLGELSCPRTLFECIFVSLSFGRSLSGVRVMLLFYVHGKHLWSCRDGQLTNPHFSWASLDLLSG